MATDDNLTLWLPLVGSTLFICLLSSVPLPLLLLLPVIAGMTYAMQAQVFYTRSLAKSFWLSTYLRADSPIREMIAGSVLLRWIAFFTALPLSVLTYIAIFGYDLWDCVAVAIGIYLARLAHQRLSSPIDANLAEHLVELAHLRIYYWLAVVFVLMSLALSSVAKGLFIDHSESTSDQLATQTIDTVKHPVRFVQHCVRTLRYSELQLLRIRDINGWPYGWFIYLFFLIPNALPAFGLVTLYAGGERILNQRIKNE
jgi:hypothetical protein